MNKKELYQAPETEVLEVKTEGIICASGGPVSPSNPFGGYEQDW